ncbi:MAG: ATP-binding protein [Coriobacteriia bacterium]|nr:ATP-binding protein [Coriobacteriia bacterium]
MKYISKIEIKRFRSFGRSQIDTEDICIYSGKNNSGKSNILRALNLFFNGETNYDSQYDYSRDYNKAYTESAGGRWSVKITLHFEPQGAGYLRYPFSISKEFDVSGQPNPEYHSTDEAINERLEAHDGNTIRQFTRYLNSIEYYYIPAVRDKAFVHHFLTNFESVIRSDVVAGDFQKRLDGLSNILREQSKELSEEFKSFIGMPTRATLSSNTADVLGAIEIDVDSGIRLWKKGKKEITAIPVSLFSSGDGVLMAYLAYFLDYLCRKSVGKKFIWGFEEPENSLEYSKAQDLAEMFASNFSTVAQIFLTTHSPAFIQLKERTDVNACFHRVFTMPPDNSETNKCLTEVRRLDKIEERVNTLFERGELSPEYQVLNEELHFVEMSREIEAAAQALEDEKEQQARYSEELKNEVAKVKEAFPSKVFICEDNQAVELWDGFLRAAGVEGVTVLSSKGWESEAIELALMGNMEIKPGYEPIVVREMDRDGLSDEQIGYIKERVRERFKKLPNYSLLVLPVNELENFALMMIPEATDELWHSNADAVCEAFEKTTQDRLQKMGQKVPKEHEDLFLGSFGRGRLDVMQDLRRVAKKNWKALMPGKDICKRILNCNPTEILQDSPFVDLPESLLNYLSDVADYFQIEREADE